MALSKLLFSKTTKKLFKKLIISWLVLFVALTPLVQPTFAQTNSEKNSQQNTLALVVDDRTEKTVTPRTVTPPSTATESGKVLQFGWLPDVPCVDPTGIVCGDGIVGGIIEEAFNYIMSAMQSLLTRIFGIILKIVLEILGFNIIQLLAGCGSAIPGITDLFGQIPTSAGTLAANSGANIFTIADIGISGVYQAVPDNGPITTIANTVKRDILGIETANAQGVGTNSLGPGILGIWSGIRNVTMILMVLVLVTIGFMVMLRKKLDPRTVVTATNSLPKIGFALLLIFFSFAISGLFIDLIYIMVGLVRGMMDGDVLGLTSSFGGEVIWFPIFTALSFSTVLDWGTFFCLPFLAPLTIPFLFGVLIFEFFMRLLFIILAFYIFWILIKNFALMIVFTIFSPVFFLLGALPGYEGVTVGWFKRMLMYALIFPIILIFIYLSLQLLAQSSAFSGFSDEISAPPPVDSEVLNISYLIAFGILFFATKVPQFLEKMFKIDGTDIRGGLGPSIFMAPVSAPAKAAQYYGQAQKMGTAALSLTPTLIAKTQPGTFAGRMADRVHNVARVVGGDTKRLSSDGSGSKTYTRSSEEIRQHQFTSGLAQDAQHISGTNMRTVSGEKAAKHGMAGSEDQMSGRTEGGVNTVNVESTGPRNPSEAKVASNEYKDLSAKLADQVRRGEISDEQQKQALNEFLKKIRK